MSETSSALVGFAVLRANYNADALSYVDNFRGFVLGVLAESAPNSLTRQAIATEMNESFGIVIPDLVVRKILKRAKHTKHIDGDAQGYTLTAAGRKIAPSVTSSKNKYLRQQQDLEARFRAFLLAEFPQHAELADAHLAKELGDYLERHAIPVLATTVSGRALNKPVESAENAFDYVIARFVTHLFERDQVGFSYLEEAAKGAILSAVVMLDTSSFKNSLNSLLIYLDTPVLINLLGYSGPDLQRASEQLIELVKAQGARIRVFEHSLRELDGVIRSAEVFLKNSNGREARPIDLYFQDKRWSAADFVIASERLPGTIGALGIEVVSKPDSYHDYGLDEEKLDADLQRIIGYRYESTRRYDLESLSAIHRLRKGSSRGSLDKCGAVLLTANSDLARASRRIEGERHEWPLAMTDSALAGIIWARSPTVASELPKNMIVAAAYAGMQPDPSLWSSYVNEVSILEGRGDVSADEAVVLRSTTVGRHALMEETLGQDSAVNSDSPLVILERLRVAFENPLLDQIRSRETSEAMATASANTAAAAFVETSETVDQLSNELKNNKDELERVQRLIKQREDSDNERRHVIRQSSDNKSRIIVASILWIVAVILVGLSLLSFANPQWLSGAPIAKNAVWVSAAIILILTVLDTLGQGTVTQWVKPLEQKSSNRLFEKARLRANL